MLVRASLPVSHYSDTEFLARRCCVVNVQVLVAADSSECALSVLPVEPRSDICGIDPRINYLAVDASPDGACSTDASFSVGLYLCCPILSLAAALDHRAFARDNLKRGLPHT